MFEMSLEQQRPLSAHHATHLPDFDHKYCFVIVVQHTTALALATLLRDAPTVACLAHDWTTTTELRASAGKSETINMTAETKICSYHMAVTSAAMSHNNLSVLLHLQPARPT
jgi:hypothetical protein